jgi:hypothetical protein
MREESDVRGLVVVGIAVAVGALLVLPASPAAAGHVAAVSSPADGATVDSTVQLRATVESGLGHSVSSVRIRLVAGGGSVIGTPVELQCVQSCQQISGEQVWGGQSLDPRSPRVVGETRPLPNGAWSVELSVNEEPWTSPASFLISYPPSPVGGLNASIEDRTVTLRWQLPPEPDVSGFHVERRRDGGTWSRVGSVGWSATSFRQTLEQDGRYVYRVLTVRPDGRGGEYLVASSSVEMTIGSPVVEESPAPTGDESATASPTSDGSDDADPVSGDDAVRHEETGTGSGSTSVGETGSSSDRPRSASGGRIAPPPAVGPSVWLGSEPDPIAAPSPEDRYYGEDDEYSDEIDYGAIDPVTGRPSGGGDPETQAVTRFLPTAIGEITVMDMHTLLSSIAAGLLLITLGLHLYNWMRQT